MNGDEVESNGGDEVLSGDDDELESEDGDELESDGTDGSVDLEDHSSEAFAVEEREVDDGDDSDDVISSLQGAEVSKVCSFLCNVRARACVFDYTRRV